MISINPILDQFADYPAEALYAKREQLRQRGLKVFDFSVGDPIEPTAAEIIETFKAGVPEVSQYPTVAGTLALRQACADWYRRRFGVSLDPKTEIIPSSGSKEAIFHVPLLVIDPFGTRRRILYGTPAYPVYERGARFAGGIPWAVELHAEQGYRLEPWNLDDALLHETAMLWINYPHNPTGSSVDKRYLKEIADFARARQILLCADECYVDLYFGDDPPPSILEVARDGVLAFHSLSKRSGMTGYRSGFIAGDAHAITRLKQLRANIGVASSEPVQHAATYAWRDEAHVAVRREVFRQKRDLFLEFFRQEGLRVHPSSTTLYLWVRVPETHSALSYADHLSDHGILVSAAPMLGVDQPYIRLALVPTVESCRDAIETWRTI